MATYSKVLLSGSTNGKGVLVSAATSGTAITIHTAVAGTSSIDLITLWASNTSTAAVELSVEWGEATASKTIKQSIPAKSGQFPIVENLPLQNGLAVTAFAATSNVLTVFGSVSRVV